jgi:putative chitinase
MENLTTSHFAKLWPHAPAPIVNGIVAAQDSVYPKYQINTDKRLAMMWAMFSEESGGWTDVVESLNYNAAALRSQWPSHFTSAQASEYGRRQGHAANQVAIGNLAYGGRMGNTVSHDPTVPGDGYNFRGRGLIQTTGREGYAAVAKETGLDCLTKPDILVDPEHALLCGVAEFANYHGILTACDNGDIVKVTRLINGGEIGLESRREWYAKWETLLGT